MKMHGLAVLAALFSSSAPVAAQNSKISTEPPLPKTAAVAPPVHKPKSAVHAAKQTVPDSGQIKAAPNTIPMDFSGMARRPVDLKSESNPAPRTDTGDQTVPPIGGGRESGFSPGMKIGF